MKLNKSLIRGSFMLLIFFNLFNIINFFFHFSMARILSVTEFGILSTLYSMIYVMSGFSESVQIVITKYSIKEKDKGKLKNILKRAFRKSFFISSILFFVYLLTSIIISKLTDIDYFLVSLTGLMLFAVFLTPISRGMLQGKRRFLSLGSNMVSESLIKLLASLMLVFLGWKVYGAIIGTLIGTFIALAISFIGLKDIIRSEEKKTDTKEVYNYILPSFFIVLGILFFYSIDVFMARIFFPPELAGAYAIASILAKTIFLGTQPISRAMFPISADNDFNKKNSKNIFFNALLLLFIAIIAALIVFYLFPSIIIYVFSGKIIPAAESVLFYLAIAISLISVANLILLYKLSLNKTRGYPYLLIFVLLEVILLGYFSNDLLQFSIAFIVSSAAFLFGAIFLLRK